jgi:DNA-directed RNA polymerase specialized sigma24 family protein
MTEKAKKWSDASVNTLLSIVGAESPVSVAKVEEAAAALEVTTRSIAAKLRQLDREVASLAKEKVSAFTEAEGADLANFVSSNAGALTYKEIAEQFAGGKFSAKQIQGKLLALELTGSVKAAEKIEAARTYTPEQEAEFVALANGGAFIEDIAKALDKTVASVRGKALSLTRSGQIAKIPAQKESHAKDNTDPVEALGADIANLTVEQIAEKTGKTERGIRTLLTRRGIKVANYDGEAKRAKAEAKVAA